MPRREVNRRARRAQVAAAKHNAVAPRSLAPTAPLRDDLPTLRAGRVAGVRQPSFSPIPSELCFGAAVADISMCWDGTLWAIDANGAPHGYDPIDARWQAHGAGVDAVAMLETNVYHFYGDSYVLVQFGTNKTIGNPIQIGAGWPTLPASFKLGVTGAAVVGGHLTLFKGGRYVSVDAPTDVKQIVQLTGWGSYSGWEGGSFDAVIGSDTGSVLLLRNVAGVAQVRRVNLVAGSAEYPVALSNLKDVQGHLPQGWEESGIDAGMEFGDNVTVFKGPALVTFGQTDTGQATPQYLGQVYSAWPAAWHPTLAHAPGGRVNNLWAAMRDGEGVVFHNGTQWVVKNGTATYAAVGQDGAVLTIGEGANSIWSLNASGGWDQLGGNLGELEQVALGNSSTMWVRETGGQTSSFSGGVLTPNMGVGTAMHIAANADGTLWHAQGDTYAYRYGGANEALPVQAGMTATITKVASTGFGNAYCLAKAPDGSSTIHAFTSPFMFKTPAKYVNVDGVIEHGLGMIYFIDRVWDSAGSGVQCHVVAIDAQTGLEIWQSAVSPLGAQVTSPIFDPRLDMLYVGSAPADSGDWQSIGWLIAVDARTGSIRWATSSAADNGTVVGIDAPPALDGSRLSVSDRQGCLHMFDTSVGAGPAVWTSSVGRVGVASRGSSPLLANGKVYASLWNSGGTIAVVECDARTGVGRMARLLGTPITDPTLFPTAEPVLAADGSGNIPFLFIQGLNEIHGVKLTQTDPLDLTGDVGFTISGGNTFSSGMVRQAGVLWVGTSNGAVYGFDSTMTPVPFTPIAAVGGAAGGAILGTPVAYKGADGSRAIFFSQFMNFNLQIFNPANGLLDQLQMGTNSYSAGLSRRVIDGMLFVGGDNPANDEQAQVFGVCVDGLISSLRQFIAESELMQDYDEPTPGAGVPVARYQTHLTVVDFQKVPQANTAVKIWADEPASVIMVNGVTCTVGPGDVDFAVAQSGHDGLLEIVSEATGVHTSSLRVWAAFMDPYERILVQPDREFHSRMMTAHDDAADQDPDKVNLVTAANYAGTPLFNADQTKRGLPGKAAAMVGQMGGAAGVGSNPQMATRSGLGRLTSGGDGQYIAYSNLSGMTYSATNSPVTRLVTVGAPIGMNLAVTAAGERTYSNMAPADAASAIDSMQGLPWQSSGPEGALGASRLGGWWSDLWDKVEQVATEVTQIIVSVTEDIYIGIQFIVKGVVQVFKAIIHTLADAVSAIAAFIKSLPASLVDLIESFGILLHFDEFIKTHVIIRNEVNAGVLGISKAIVDNAIPQLDAFFESGENAVVKLIDDLKAAVSGKSINQLQGQGATEHTVYAITPKDGSVPKSHAVQCSWATCKLKRGLVTVSGVGAVSDPLPMPPVLSDFINQFVARIQGDGDLSLAITQVETDFHNLLNPSSVSDMLTQGVDTLLDTLKVLLVGSLVISNAFLDGMLKVLSDLMSDLFSGGGIFNETIQIPVLSWLYTKLTGEPLTFLNIVTLVAAIPTTIVYRVATGHYPSQDLGEQKASTESTHLSDTGLGSMMTTLMGVFGALLSIPSGLVSGLIDSLGKESAPPLMAKVALTFSVLIAVASLPGSFSAAKPLDWAAWGAVLGAQATNIFGVVSLPLLLSQVLTFALPMVYALCNVASLSIFIDQLAQLKGGLAKEIATGLSIASTLPGVLNPLKLVKEELAVAVACLDGVLGFSVGGIQLMTIFSI